MTTDRRALFTWVAQRTAAPIAVACGAGAWFWDAGGRRYLDLASIVFSANAGWQHPTILAALPAPPGPTFPHNLLRRRGA